MRPALDEYVLASLLLQQKQEPGHQHKIEALAKVLALKSAPALFQRLRASTTIRPLPSKSHCKNFLDSYPSVQLWTEHYRGANREDLTAAVKAVQGVDAAEEEGSAQSKEVQLRQATLDLIAFDLVHNRFESAFSLLTTIPLPELPADTSSELDSSVPLTYLTPFSEEHRSNAQMLLSLQYELVGFEKHLRCDLDGAVSCLLTSLRAYPNNIDARLKLANVYLEQPDAAACTAAYDSLLAFLESQEAAAKEAGAMVEEEEGGDVLQVLAVMKGWALLHKVSVYVTR